MNHDSGLSAWVDEGSFALCAARMNAHAFGLLLRLVVRPGGCRYPGKARVAAARSLIDAVALGASKTVASFVGSMELEALGEPFYYDHVKSAEAVAASTGATPAADGMAGAKIDQRARISILMNTEWPFHVSSADHTVPLEWRDAAVSHPGPFSVRVVASRVPLPMLGSSELLAALVQVDSDKLWASPCMSAVLYGLWHVHMKWYHYMVCGLILVEVLAYFVVAAAKVEGTVPVLCEVLAFLVVVFVAGILLILEARQYWSLHMEKRADDPRLQSQSALAAVWTRLATLVEMYSSVWDLSDLLSQLMLLYCAASALFGAPRNQQLMQLAVAAIPLMVKVMNVLRGFEDIAQFVQVLLQSLYDMVPLLLICVVLVIFGGVCLFLMIGTVPPPEGEEAEGWNQLMSRFWSALGVGFQMGMLGEFGDATDVFAETSSPVFTWLVFCCYMLALTIVALNALIALLGETYARVQEQATATRNAQLADLIVDYYDIIGPERCRAVEEQTLWTHVLDTKASLEAAASLDGGEWHGRVAEIQLCIKREVRDARLALEARFGGLGVFARAEIGSEAGVQHGRAQAAEGLDEVRRELSAMRRQQQELAASVQQALANAPRVRRMGEGAAFPPGRRVASPSLGAAAQGVLVSVGHRAAPPEAGADGSQ